MIHIFNRISGWEEWRAKQKLVLIGNGMAGVGSIEEILKLIRKI